MRRLAGKLTPDNHESVLARAVHKTREEVEILVRELDPLPDLRSSVRKAAVRVVAGPLPAPDPALAAFARGEEPGAFRPARHRSPPMPPDPRPIVRPSASEALPRQVHHRRGGASEAPARPDPAAPRDPGRGPGRHLRSRGRPAPKGREEEARRGEAESGQKPRTPGRDSSIRPGTDNPPARASRHIPSGVKRAVSERDADQCAFLSPEGRRCTQRAFLEFHHIQPFAHQGPATAENISLRCRAHNAYEGELVFGAFDAAAVREKLPRTWSSIAGDRFQNLLVPRRDRRGRTVPRCPESDPGVPWGPRAARGQGTVNSRLEWTSRHDSYPSSSRWRWPPPHRRMSPPRAPKPGRDWPQFRGIKASGVAEGRPTADHVERRRRHQRRVEGRHSPAWGSRARSSGATSCA